MNPNRLGKAQPRGNETIPDRPAGDESHAHGGGICHCVGETDTVQGLVSRYYADLEGVTDGDLCAALQAALEATYELPLAELVAARAGGAIRLPRSSELRALVDRMRDSSDGPDVRSTGRRHARRKRFAAQSGGGRRAPAGVAGLAVPRGRGVSAGARECAPADSVKEGSEARQPKSSESRPLTAAAWTDSHWAQAYRADAEQSWVERLTEARADVERLEAEHNWLANAAWPSLELRMARRKMRMIESDVRKRTADFERVTRLLAPGTESRARFVAALEAEISAGNTDAGVKELYEMLGHATPRQLYEALDDILTRVIRYHRGMGASTPYLAMGTYDYSFLQELWNASDLTALAWTPTD